MNNQQSFARLRGNNQPFLKSQKALNSVGVLHLRTEAQESVESRSPEACTQLRQTWRRPRMPYNKLPDAFQIREKRKKSNRELLVNLDRIVKINQYKEIQKLLEPIAPSRPLEMPRSTHSNPLATIHKFFRIETRFRQQLTDEPSLFKHKAYSYKSQTPTLRLNECITLGVVKRGNHTGTIKKVLHVPTFRLLCVRQEPLNNREQRASAKNWLEFWQTRLNILPHFLPLHTLLFNVPEGALSVATDHIPNGSLRDLLESVFTLPESVIREIFSGVFTGLNEFYSLDDLEFNQLGGLSPSQILFSETGKPLLGLGLFYRLNSNSSSNFYNLRASPPPKMDMNTSQQSFLTPFTSAAQAEVDRSLDVFKLGLMMLECAIGGLQDFEQTPLLFQAIRNTFSEEAQLALQKDNVCCLIHSQGYLLGKVGLQDDRSRRDRVDLSQITPYAKHLKDRYSLSFVNFLCITLKLVHSSRANLKSLMGHSFLVNESDKDTKTAQIRLSDLLAINSGWNLEIVQSMGEEQNEKLLNHILHVFLNLNRHVTADLLNTHKDKILSLSKLIGLNSIGLGQKLYQAMIQIAQPKRDFNTSI